jgi:hypothetical protein
VKPAGTRSLAVVWLGAAVLALAGSWWTAVNLRQMTTYARFASRQAADMDALSELGRQLLASESALRAVEAAGPAPEEGPEQTLKRALPDVPVAAGTESRRDAIAGWKVRSVRVTVSEAPAGKLLAALAGLEARRPPWRIRRMEIQSSAHEPGTVRAVVEFECLARAGQE